MCSMYVHVCDTIYYLTIHAFINQQDLGPSSHSFKLVASATVPAVTVATFKWRQYDYIHIHIICTRVNN